MLPLDEFEFEEIEDNCDMCCELEPRRATKIVRGFVYLAPSAPSCGFELRVCDEHADELNKVLCAAINETVASLQASEDQA